MSEIATKRRTLRDLLGQQKHLMAAEGRGAMANMYYGYQVRVDKGRYDDRLDEMIAEARQELAKQGEGN